MGKREGIRKHFYLERSPYGDSYCPYGDGYCLYLGEVLLETLTLPIALKNRNDGQSKHWGQSDKAKKEFINILALLYPNREAYRVPVTLVVTRVYGKAKRHWDEDSILRGTYKQLQDAMVDTGFFVDDSPKHIKAVYGQQEKGKKDETRIEVFCG